MTSLSALAGALVAVATVAHARPVTAPKRPPGRPTLPLVRVVAAQDHVVVTEDVRIPRGGWSGGDVDLFVAFGAPGTPRAVDARVYAGTDDEPAPDATFDVVAVSRAARCPAGVALLLGPPAMAGVVLRVRAAAFARASDRAGAVQLRIRTLLDAPATDSSGRGEVLVRLGTYDGEPDALESVDVAASPPRVLERAEARLVGEGADAHALALARPLAGDDRRDIVAPLDSVRHAADDLSVRYWLRGAR